MMRWDVINHLIEKNNYKTYLEIGYFQGWSFDNVICQQKEAVDPNPLKNEAQAAAPYTALLAASTTSYAYLHKLTSDMFFLRQPMDSKWDIIFIDGLHEAKQVTKDIENSLKHLSPKGTIVLHDCNPPKYEHTTTGIDGCWTGDAYKALLRFRGYNNSQYPNPYHIYTIDTDWGIGIIQESKSTFDEEVSCLRHITESDEDWDVFNINRKELLNLISVEEFLKRTNENSNSPA